ncbi:MAG: hypothetical protein ACW7DR_15390 [Paraglaciecola chathamensis]
MSFSDKIAFGALCVAIISLFFAFISYRLSVKAYRLTNREHQDKYLNIKPYLIDAKKWSDKGEDYISFAISYTNEATSANSLKTIGLQLEFYDDSKLLKIAKIDPAFDVSPINLAGNYKALELPMTFTDKETKSGWVTFKLSKDIWKEFIIDIYRVNALTASNSSVSVETHLVNTVNNEN